VCAELPVKCRRLSARWSRTQIAKPTVTCALGRAGVCVINPHTGVRRRSAASRNGCVPSVCGPDAGSATRSSRLVLILVDDFPAMSVNDVAVARLLRRHVMKSIANPHSAITPTLYVGKGIGDLPESLKYLKPIAISSADPNSVVGRNRCAIDRSRRPGTRCQGCDRSS
jgi:hypothetical protein